MAAFVWLPDSLYCSRRSDDLIDFSISLINIRFVGDREPPSNIAQIKVPFFCLSGLVYKHDNRLMLLVP